ncbi:hypothetical protein ACFLFF_05815 [Brevibacillus reuszeri]|uniref:hypothetical protein n=1 Tax=Brevibacillus reuszeri TaxID=54915 RepID=UPI00366A64E7
MKQFLIFFVLLSLLLSGCGNDTSIRKELYDDSLKYYNLLNERIMAAEIISMSRSLEIINEVYLILDKKDYKDTVEDFVRSKLEAAKILGLE